MRRLFRPAVAAAVLVSGAGSASAHHVADGVLPSSLREAVLSGLAHPVIEADHLAFAVAVGLAAALLPRASGLVGSFLAAALGGLALRAVGIGIPSCELGAAASIVVAGLGLVVATGERSRLWLAIAAVGGLLHGCALGESIAGAGPALVIAYALSAVTALALVLMPVFAVAEFLLVDDKSDQLRMRAAGGAVAATGLLFLGSSLVAI